MQEDRLEKIAVILYTVDAHAKSVPEAARTLTRLREIGYRNIQVSGSAWSALEPAVMKQLADDAGLKIIGSHIALDQFRENLPAVIDRLHLWDCHYTAIPIFHADRADLRKSWKDFAEECNVIGERVKREGIQLQYHNHHFEFELFGMVDGRGGTTPFEILRTTADRALLQSELDIGWVARAGVDPTVPLLQVKNRADQVHMKDWCLLNGEPGWRAVGEGSLNWSRIVDACRRAHVKTYIVEQDDCPVTNDPFRSLEISLENLVEMDL